MSVQIENRELWAAIHNAEQSAEDQRIILPVGYVSFMPNFLSNSRDTINAFLNLTEDNAFPKNMYVVFYKAMRVIQQRESDIPDIPGKSQLENISHDLSQFLFSISDRSQRFFFHILTYKKCKVLNKEPNCGI